MTKMAYWIGPALMAAFGLAMAAEPAPSIEIGGAIRTYTDQATRVYQLSERQFQSLPQSSVTTSTAWTKPATFTGVRMSDIARLTGAQSKFVRVYALDDYSVRIPVSDFAKYGVIIARYMNGQPLQRNSFGPYFIIYPKDRFPAELSTPTSEAKFVWQVNRLVFDDPTHP